MSGCVSHGLPQAKRVADTFSPQDVCVLGLHSVFEHHDAQGTREALGAFLHEYRISFPVGIDAPSDEGRLPKTMTAYVGDLSCGAAGHICWGITPGSVGYLVIDAMQDYVAGNDEQDSADDLAALNALPDEAFLTLSATDALIVDIRQNQGGQESVSLEIAGRFIEEQRLTYRKRARDKDTFANLHDIYLTPTGASPYANPVYVLTSGGTYSGAESFALSMMQLPQVTIIGEPSGGIFSDMISKELPNGWTFTLSAEVYSDLDGNVYEGVGIPVDHFVDFYVPSDVIAGHDPAIEQALSLIAAQ